MYMARPRQCNKDVNIQQHRHGQSLSASLTSSLVTGREFASTRKEGMPSTYSNSPVPLNPRRANSDIASPRLLPLRSANARATASTSSSIVSVVRIMASYHQSISLSRAEASGVHQSGGDSVPAVAGVVYRLLARRSAGARPGRTVESVSWGRCEGRHRGEERVERSEE